ncbi:hypothetical protein K788_0005219 [Paraburkholderia caribensis MBA4]|uniref:Uncharacterized protein n=1 Tax=Paraburkholderia caribensis MBA4 TaxID=1323664 RepID=A0A0P0RF67_9BURK|nr:hypothetical protein K788_0005219 [Paraburkholderia caribensis MBA4]
MGFLSVCVAGRCAALSATSVSGLRGAAKASDAHQATMHVANAIRRATTPIFFRLDACA